MNEYMIVAHVFSHNMLTNLAIYLLFRRRTRLVAKPKQQSVANDVPLHPWVCSEVKFEVNCDILVIPDNSMYDRAHLMKSDASGRMVQI